MTKRRNIVIWTALGFAAAMAAGAATIHQARADCPGKIVCPLTGDLVCRDKCPLGNADRVDCPGTIDCPLTGDAVCRDQCPLTDEARGASSVTPCCVASVDASTPDAKPAAKQGCCP